MTNIDEIPFYQPPLIFFEQGRFRQSLKDKNPIGVFKDAITAVNHQLDHRFTEGEDIRKLVYDRSDFLDCILHYAWNMFSWPQNVALLAVGGYGRAELHPYSDIDLLILSAEDELGEAQLYADSVQGFITLLWDIGLDIGHSVRSINQCIEIASTDISVATNLMECRTLEGAANLQLLLQAHTGADKIWTAADFFIAKRQEQVERHNKHNNTEYNLEPNVKNAPGGLRDIQIISWVAKRFFGEKNFKDLAGKGLFTSEEYDILLAGEEALWKVRYALHMIAGRAEERLLFDYQRDIAKLFGYKDDQRLAVENFMHWYYRIVLSLHEVNDVMLQYLDEAILQAGNNQAPQQINERFRRVDNYIEVNHSNIFEQNPSALIEIFVILGQDPSFKGVRASTIRLIRENRHLIDDDYRSDPVNQQLFLSLFRESKSLVTQLKRMKRYGILGLYLPEFGQVTGQMQHDLFHIYTVDAHTLLVIDYMRRFSHPEMSEQFPIASQVVKRLDQPELLYLAGLYHDIGKGRGGDHSELGAVDAQLFCQQHGLSKRQTRLISWLVEKHLLMSTVSQKQDISDPEVIYNFAMEVGDEARLDYLYALTVADMNATNPDIWNSWRASLMRQLYIETRRALRRGLENTVDKQELIDETQQLAMAKLADQQLDPELIQELWQSLGEDYFLRESYTDICWQTEAIIKHDSLHGDKPLIIIADTTSRSFEGATEIFIRIKDRPNIFAAVATAFSQLHLNILDARIYSSETGFTIDTFYVLDENNQTIGDDNAKKCRIEAALQKELALLDDDFEFVKRRTPRQLKYFAMPTRTSINNDIVSGYTVLEVISPDRPGFLSIIGGVFLEHDVQLHNAKITTLGERVEDVFFITDVDGKPLSDPQLCQDLQDIIRRRLDQQVSTEQG